MVYLKKDDSLKKDENKTKVLNSKSLFNVLCQIHNEEDNIYMTLLAKKMGIERLSMNNYFGTLRNFNFIKHTHSFATVKFVSVNYEGITDYFFELSSNIKINDLPPAFLGMLSKKEIEKIDPKEIIIMAQSLKKSYSADFSKFIKNYLTIVEDSSILEMFGSFIRYMMLNNVSNTVSKNHKKGSVISIVSGSLSLIYHYVWILLLYMYTSTSNLW